MRSPQSPSALGRTAARIGLTAGSGGAGTLAALALAHRAGATAIAAGAVSVALAAQVAESAGRTLPGIIAAISNLLTSCIRARADAKATVIHAKTRAELAKAGLDPSQPTSSAAEMQRMLALNPDLSKDRRPADETLIKLQGSHRRSNSGESGTGPDAPGNGPRTRRATTDKVVLIRPDE
jgi:hypothetical protein